MAKDRSNLRPVESDPADVVAARQLRSEVETFNAEAEKRTAISPSDQQSLDRIRTSVEAFRVSRTAAVFGDHDYDSSSTAAKEIISAIARYLKITEGEQVVEIAGETLTTPSIDSPAVRAHIRRDDAKILSNLSEYVDDRIDAMNPAGRAPGGRPGNTREGDDPAVAPLGCFGWSPRPLT